MPPKQKPFTPSTPALPLPQLDPKYLLDSFSREVEEAIDQIEFFFPDIDRAFVGNTIKLHLHAPNLIDNFIITHCETGQYPKKTLKSINTNEEAGERSDQYKRLTKMYVSNAYPYLADDTIEQSLTKNNFFLGKTGVPYCFDPTNTV